MKQDMRLFLFWKRNICEKGQAPEKRKNSRDMFKKYCNGKQLESRRYFGPVYFRRASVCRQNGRIAENGGIEMSLAWKRMSVLSSFYFIRRSSFKEIFAFSEIFLYHQHDLMRKAVGWMLREAGKRNADALYGFLDKNHKNTPGAMLRYALEKLSGKKRRLYTEKWYVFCEIGFAPRLQ